MTDAKTLAVNVDPSRGDAPPGVIVELGARAVRIVVLPGIGVVLDSYRRAGLRVLAVVAQQSVAPFGSYAAAAEAYAKLAGLVDWWQIGNEPDTLGESSWTQTQQEFAELCEAFAAYSPIIAGGFANNQGDAGWLERDPDACARVLAVVDYLGVHYPLSGHKIQEYRRYNKPIQVTEGYTDTDIERAILQEPDVSAYYDWWHDPVGTGTLGLQGHPDRIAAFRRLAMELTVPEFKLGFKDYAASHPEVGQPVEDEWTERQTPGTVQRQDTTTGSLRYYGQSNLIVFSPKE